MSEMSDKERAEQAEAELAELRLAQAKAEAAAEEGGGPKAPIWLAMAILAAILAGVGFVVLRGGDEVELTAAELNLERQTACFEAGLFYDEFGACFNDAELTIRNTSVNGDVQAAPATTTTKGTRLLVGTV